MLVKDVIDFAGGFSLDANQKKEIILIRLDESGFRTINENSKETDQIKLKENDRIFVKFNTIN